MEDIILDSELSDATLTEVDLPPIIHVWKFLLLSFFTLGLYPVYWFYRFWRYVKTKENEDIRPVWRAIFGVLFSFSLVNRIAEYGRAESIPSYMSATFIGITYLILNALNKLPEPYNLIVFLAPFVFIQPLNVLNEYVQRKGQVMHRLFSVAEVVILVIGGIFCLLILIGLTIEN